MSRTGLAYRVAIALLTNYPIPFEAGPWEIKAGYVLALRLAQEQVALAPTAMEAELRRSQFRQIRTEASRRNISLSLFA